MKHFFKVKFGYGVQDYVSVTGTDIDKAIYAQLSGNPVQLGSSFVNGKNIISITPHYHKYTGWNEFYEPKDGEDWVQIQRDCPNFDGVIENHKNHVAQLMSTGQTKMIGKTEAPQKISIEGNKSNADKPDFLQKNEIGEPKSIKELLG